MDSSQSSFPPKAPAETITRYIARADGLVLKDEETGDMTISQRVDGRSIKITSGTIEEVLCRQDSEGQDFLQVNFADGRKILITEKIVGFKPAETDGLDLRKLPKVVTTPDLVSVIEAIEESLNSRLPQQDEIEVLKKVFNAVLYGAEAVGFEMSQEKTWLNFIANTKHKPSA